VTSGIPESARWEEVDLRDELQRQSLSVAIAALQARADAGAGLMHDLAWLLEADGRGLNDVRVLVFRIDGALVAYAPLLVQAWTLRFRLGEITLFSRALTRLHMNGGPVVWTNLPPDAQAGIVARLLHKLRDILGHRQVVSLEGVVQGSALDLAVGSAATRSTYAVLTPSPRYERSLVRLPHDFDEYMKSLKPQTRQNLRNSQRKLEKRFPGQVRLVACSRVEDVPGFVERAVSISRKTYQWHLLGLGLRQPEQLTQTLASMARHGWTRCYLLECGGVPVAFMIGYLYGTTYYYIDVGFDPDWEQWSVGTVLHLMVFRALIEGEENVEWFDFSSGTGVHKKRFGNVSRTESNYVLLPRNAGNHALVAMHRGFDAMSRTAVQLLERLRLKAAAKRLVRRAATAKARAE
jgi:hypothetical protein